MKYIVLVFLFLSACEKERSIAQHAIVYIKTSVDKPSECQSMGPVTGATIKSLGVGESYKKALLDIKRSAKSLGANYLYLKRVSSDSKFIAGEAYYCKN